MNHLTDSVPGLTIFRSSATQDIVDRAKGFCDLVGLPGLALEAKRTNALRLEEAFSQAERNASGGDAPVVITRRDRQSTEDSRVIIRLRDFLPFYTAWLHAQGHIK